MEVVTKEEALSQLDWHISQEDLQQYFEEEQDHNPLIEGEYEHGVRDCYYLSRVGSTADRRKARDKHGYPFSGRQFFVRRVKNSCDARWVVDQLVKRGCDNTGDLGKGDYVYAYFKTSETNAAAEKIEKEKRRRKEFRWLLISSAVTAVSTAATAIFGFFSK